MKIKILLPCFFLAFFLKPFTGKAQVNTQDSLALVDLYNSTNGPGWVNHTSWLTTAPLNTWFGVTIETNAVLALRLSSNNLNGTLPNSFGNLSFAQDIELSFNRISGNIPSTIGGLTNIFVLSLDHNQLSGRVPDALISVNSQNYPSITIEYNKLTFDGIELIGSDKFSFHYDHQANLPLIQNGNILSVSAGGTMSKNTYKWYKDDALVLTKTGDSTFSFTTSGNYSVEVANANAQFLKLYSITTANLQDSLAIVDLYNNTNGSQWLINTNWLSLAPLASWYGITLLRGKLTTLEIMGNNMAGSLPQSIGNLVNAGWINLTDNKLTGAIPATIGNLVNTSTLYLESNKLTGSIPEAIGNMIGLQNLNLSNNQLTGNIPTTFNNIQIGNILLSHNQLSGSIPGNINKTNFSALDLSYNQLTGSIPSDLGNFTFLNSILLNNNQLTGSIPSSIGRPKYLRFIDFSNNQLTGSIPDSVTNLPQPFSTLNLSNNQLTGKIPDSLSKISNGADIELNGNKLSGTIPSFASANMLRLYLQDNSFTFEGIEPLAASPPTVQSPLLYSPQAFIPITKTGNTISVSAGGTVTNDTFRLYRDSILLKTQTGDSIFVLTGAGKYYVTVTNSIATQLTLTSTIDTIIGLVIADTTVSVTQNIAGTTPVLAEDSVLHKLIATLTPTAGVNALSGSVTSTVFIDKTISVFNNQPYVQRHYDITPATNAANAQATVTLYFTQQEFDNFNAYPGHGLSLPTGPSDAAGKANLRVYQFHGFSATSLPGTYSGNAVEINPADGNIVWNAAAQYWEVSFAVNGFSGFFISSLNGAILPIKLLSFSGTVLDKKATLKWITTAEINASYYELQRSSTGNNFNAITKIAASGSSSANLNYQYTDMLGSDPVYFYRLKMADKDGGFTLSNVVKLSSANNAMFTIFPNPAKAFVFVNLPVATTDSKIKISDMAGRVLRTIDVKKSTSQLKLNTGNLTAGTYKIIYNDGEREVSKMMIIE
ncbi:T9SS type A sorting domain-containing protein [Ferruginibacter paludis]|uniref:T9SS type A sorting domain-containing protein n=1 Tax=Ferruginibacter paludis TaxID=1310417 RepID=UPI0025B46A6A|nr:T9SS type A sorting domain-containing protein [Ferruginibacter paludis]MDN3656648.1 T9SS type A sorting domain-containing protein [Ferruginibacter paludis]